MRILNLLFRAVSLNNTAYGIRSVRTVYLPTLYGRPMTADKNSFLFQYKARNTVIHRLPAGVKFCGLCLSSFTLYGAPQTLLAVYAVCLVFIGFCAKISSVTIKRNCRFLCIYTVCIFFIKIIEMPFNLAVLKATAMKLPRSWKFLCSVRKSSAFFVEENTRALFRRSLLLH